jgi:hypothetical protein
VTSAIPFLPPLRPGLPDLTAYGQWEADDALALRQLSSALDVRGTQSDSLAATSIPDVWAQPLSFLAAWRDPSHIWFSRARGEWRGLLAILGLPEPERLALGLQVIDINLDELRRNPWDIREGGRPTMSGNLMEILAQYCPKVHLSSQQRWTRLGLIAARDRPLGLIVPANLVCPAREYQRYLPEEVDWRDEETGWLIDPCTSGRMPAARAIALATYLDHLLACIEAMSLSQADETIDRELYGAVRGALSEYLNDVQKLPSVRRNARHPPEFRMQSMPQGLSELPHSFLAQAVVPSPVPRAEPFSDALLVARPELAGGPKGAAVVGGDVARMLGRPPQDFRIWGAYSLSDVMGSPRLQQVAAEQAAEGGYELLSVAELFTEEFVEVEGGDAKAHPPSARDCLLPLNPRVLRYLDPRSLRSRLRIVRDGKTVQVELDLPLLDSDGASRTYTARKTYSEAVIVRVPLPTALVTWPNFVSEHWKHHYIFYASEGLHPRPRQAISPRTLSLDVQNPDALRSAGPGPKIFPQSDGSEIGILRMDHRPEALSCEVLDQERATNIAGLLLLDQVPDVVASEEHWRVGVDFGTTNTSIHYLREGPQVDHPRRMRFSPRLTAPIGYIDVSKVVLQRDFLPDDVVDIPFLSILQESIGARSSGAEPFIRQRVHYVRDVASTLQGFAPHRRDHELRFNLKWSRDRADLARFEAYLSQVCMQSLAELVAMGAAPSNVQWSFSQPGSFSSQRADEFAEAYGRVIRFACGIENESQIAQPDIRLESEAAALYFLKREKIPLGFTAFTLDVGGQTTDVCLWHNRRLLWQTSVHFAGQHILIPYLASRREALSEALKSQGNLAEIGNILDTLEGLGLSQGLEVIVNSELFRTAFDLHASVQRNPARQGLQGLAEFSLAGLLYYLGLVARHLTNAEQLPAALLDLRICLGGRGSLIFKSVLDERELFASYFSEVSGLAVGNLAFHTSHDPKHEVSFGMLVPARGAGEIDLSRPYKKCILGEAIDIGDRTKTELEVLEDGEEDQAWRVKSLPQFEKFLELYTRSFKRSLTIDAKRRKDLMGRVDNGIADLRAVLQNDRNRRASRLERAEPVFIFPLRELVLMMNEAGETLA